MDKKKLIAEIIDLCDKVDALERENAEVKTAKKYEKTPVDDLVVAGRKRLFEQVKAFRLDYYYNVEKNGKLLTLFEWLETLDWEIFSGGVCSALNNHSLKDLVEYFMEELTEVYDKKLDELEARLKEKAKADEKES